MSECVMHGCHETARWAVGAAKTALCAKHMIDSVAEVGFGNVVATRLPSPPADIVERLRRWVHAVDAMPASDLMDQAAAEIERLRLTDAEREAVEGALFDAEQRGCRISADALRGLLERLT